MKALVKTGRVKGFSLQDRPLPSAGPGEVLLRVRTATICGSDLHLYTWNAWADSFVPSLPLGVGHEMGGEVAGLGSGVEGLAVGDLVSVESHLWCGRCPSCRGNLSHLCTEGGILGFHRDGSMAEFVVVPARNCRVAPPGTSPETASLKEPFGNAVQTVNAQPVAGRATIVTGCGPLGLMTVMVAKAMGAAPLIATDLLPARREQAASLGADLVLDPVATDVRDAVREATGGEGAQVLLELSGAPAALAAGMEALAPGGDIAILGLYPGVVPVSMNEQITFKGATLRGITGRLLWDTWEQVDELIHVRGLDPASLITHRFALDDHSQAFALMERGTGGKIALYPHAADLAQA
ncbi:alcohol dehydrogenase catalytic domain-containing protein [bacterium]|nr:alcohol dehydrogenase catalytic domain-containing protein [bacterium]